MEGLELLVDLHRNAERQGPGGAAETRRAIELSGLRQGAALRVADIGCGTGASTLVLAQELDATITAVDFLPAFLDELEGAAAAAGLSDRISTLEASMDALPFAPQSLDAIWSEGAVYNIGFTSGISQWRRFLKPGGVLAVSELTWLTRDRPEELEAHWLGQYPEVDTAAAKMGVLEDAGFSPLGYFPLPGQCWLENYYRPMQARFAGFLERHGNSPAARAIVEAEQQEIALFERHAAHYSYGFYVAKRTED